MEQKIKQDTNIIIGENIKQLRKDRKLKQHELVAKLQLANISMTREALVKIEAGNQHIYASQLKAIKDILEVSYDDLLKEK